MKSPRATAAFTLIELVLIVGVVLLLTLMLFPAMGNAKKKSQRIDCVNNLKQVGLSFRMWSPDDSDRFAMRCSTNVGGTLEVANQVWRTFQALSNELGMPKMLLCPADTRPPAQSWRTLANSNISYFNCLDAAEVQPQVFLSGDRNVTNGSPLTNHVMRLGKGDPAGWTADLHPNCGNVTISDGSVHQLDSARLRQAVTNAGPIYFEGRTNEAMRLALPE
jgi:type II secretory pathway pseudopilin PulG